MCGLFGWVGDADPVMARRISELASTRGPHAHGWVARKGEQIVSHAIGPLKPRAGELPMAADRLIGHARLATTGSGSWSRLEDAQPLQAAAGGVAVAHNGNVYDVDGQASLFQVRLETGNDSELILRLLSREIAAPAADPVRSLTWVIRSLMPENPYALLVLLPDGSLLAARRRLPLYRLQVDGKVTYVCSRDPGSGVNLPENKVVEL